MNKEVELLWVPGHSGIEGNEKTDRLAKRGSQSPFCGPEPVFGITRNQIKIAIKDWCFEAFRKHWFEREDCRQAKDMAVQPDQAKTAWLLRKDRRAVRNLVAVLTGHCSLRGHLSKIGIETDSLCLQCGVAEETSAHYLLECERYNALRLTTFGVEEILPEEVQFMAWSDILSFIKRSGRLGQKEE